ncbi:MAG: 3-phosphoshikimate 1-carboxyvinyltransferase [bacterium]
MEQLTVEHSKGIRGEITVPGDKSISHRAVILGSIADGMTEVTGLLRGEDSLNTLRAFQKMGVEIKESGDRILIRGAGLRGLKEPVEVLDMGNSGTGIRLLSGLLAGQDLFAVLAGDASLGQRPMGRVTRPLRQMGAKIFGRDDGCLAPLAIQGSELHGIDYVSPVASAQVKSALLLAGLNAEGRTSVTEPSLSRDHTERMLRWFGVTVERQGTTVSVNGKERLSGSMVHVPSDFSSAAFFIVAALIVDGSDLLIRNVGINPTRTGLLAILERMGAKISLQSRDGSDEPVADIHVQTSDLKGTDVAPEEVPAAIDEFPILCVAAAVASGTTRISGASELRFKETDRIRAMTVNLQIAGVEVEELEDGLVIHGQERLNQAECNSFGDHRVAMAMAVAGLRSGSGITILDTGCIRTSFPGFEEILKGVNRGRK